MKWLDDAALFGFLDQCADMTPQVAMPGAPWVLGQTVSGMPFNTATNRWTGLGSGDVDAAGEQTGQLCVTCGSASE